MAEYIHMHVDLKRINLAQQNTTDPAMSLVCVPLPLCGPGSSYRSLSRLQRDSQPVACLLGKTA